ncbi:MAG TPA: LuxR C-terminal-related transcriptional regulator [Gaiellaceae bacterium]|jgi:LuxR family maltose regulon positive regulatory protein
MLEAVTPSFSPALDHLIERPRLIARLEEDGGRRVTVLAAPAGYGKTTLARQWSECQAGPVAWYRTRRASGDVALLAVQFDELLASVASEVAREPLQVPAIAAVNPSAEPLAEAIVRKFEPLTRDVLLVVDEWEAAGTDEAEELMSILVQGLALRFLITARTRPVWFTPRMEVYGDGLEIAMDELAMTEAEAAEVIAGSEAASGRGRLLRTAGGWPAVLGLAAMSGEADLAASPRLTEALYDFLAGELLANAAPQTQHALMLFAVAAVADVSAARIALGASTDDVIADAVECGLLTVTGRRSLSLHPLLRELLVQRFGESDPETRETVLTRSRNFFPARLWDEALCVAEVAREPSFAAEAIAAALDDLLAAGRTSSLERWVAAAHAAGAEGGLVDYAESEAQMRRGGLDRAAALATQAARSLEGDLAARAHLVAGTAAHLTERPELAEEHAQSATATAQELETRERALWLRFLAGVGPEKQDLRDRLDEFRCRARSGVKESLMVATAQVVLATEIEGGLQAALDDARRALSLAEGDVDPIAHTGLLSGYSHALNLGCRYEETLRRTGDLIRLAESYGLEFAVCYAKFFRAEALVGLRRFGQAARTFSLLEREMDDEPGLFFRANVPLQRARIYASVGDLKRALEVLVPGPNESYAKNVRGEHLAWQALLHAAAGETPQAETLAVSARRESCGPVVEALSLIAEAGVDLAVANRRGAATRLSTVIESGIWDPLVIALRAMPALGAFMADQTEWRSWLQRLLAASADTSLGRSLGLQLPRAATRNAKLTPRETEIHELLAQGRTNEQIAKLLHISVSTAKVHVKHIYEKLGVRSRAEAARALP